jgi:hypothetical protein
VHGTVVVSKFSGVISINTKGLSNKFTASVLYNPNIRAIGSVSPESNHLNVMAPTKEPPWPITQWCTKHKVTEPELITAVRILKTSRAIQQNRNKEVVDSYVNAARDAQAAYELASSVHQILK